MMQGGLIDRNPFTILPYMGQDEVMKMGELVQNQVLPLDTTLHKWALMDREFRRKIMYKVIGEDEDKFMQ